MNGFINLLKPPGISSNAAVVQIRRLLGVKKVGHTGTLDPGAAGVLAVCLGKATKLSDFMMNSSKEYIAEISFGRQTDTQDSYGSVTAEKACKVTLDAFAAVLPQFVGKITQITPAYSAAKQNGQALYKLALKGQEIVEKKRFVEIFSLEPLAEVAQNRFLFRAACEKGTYIRTLCEDIGKALSLPAHMSMLIRTKTSGFCIEDSYTQDEIEALHASGNVVAALIPVDAVLSCYPRLDVPDGYKIQLFNGNEVCIQSLANEPEGMYRIYCGGVFLGTGRVSEGAVRIETLLLGE
jgi:tRNA pseudouridine55 synthase